MRRVSQKTNLDAKAERVTVQATAGANPALDGENLFPKRRRGCHLPVALDSRGREDNEGKTGVGGRGTEKRDSCIQKSTQAIRLSFTRIEIFRNNFIHTLSQAPPQKRSQCDTLERDRDTKRRDQ